jgi:hypothetical protein
MWVTQEGERIDNVTWAGLLFPFLLVHFCLCCPHADGQSGEETGAGYGIGEVKVTATMAETDLEGRVLKLNTIHTL